MIVEKVLKTKKGLYQITIDNKNYLFSEDTVVQFHLIEGHRTTQKEIDLAIKSEDVSSLFHKAVAYALKYGAGEKRVRDYLKRKEEDKAHYETEIINVSNFYYNSFAKFIHYLYKDEHMKVKNFGNDLIEGYIKTKDNYLLTLLLQYKNFHIKQIQQIFSSYLIYFGITKIDVLKRSYYQEYLSSRWPIKKEQFCAFAGIKIEDLDKIIAETIGRKKITNKNIGIFLQMSNEVLNDNRDAFLKLLDSIDKPLQNLLFFSVWRFKGKIMGVHNDFGRLSFIQSNQICPVYHCSKEEQYEICLQMMSLLETIDNEYNEEKEN